MVDAGVEAVADVTAKVEAGAEADVVGGVEGYHKAVA